jgi:UDP-N-acetylglucosamine 2-epimerase (non-hydrolysing)
MIPKRVTVFVGTRPEGIKMAPVIRALEAAGDLQPIVISTGQHREMLEQVFDLFQIRADEDLAVMTPNQTLAGLTARLIDKIDGALERWRPDMALVQGDTTTVLAAALTCFYRDIPIGHVEAGLRSGDLRAPFPEEANRALAGKLTTLHFAPTEGARENLLREGVADEWITVTGNTVVDALQMERDRQRAPEVAEPLRRGLAERLGECWDRGRFVLVTGHRRESFGAGFERICSALAELAQRFPDTRFVYPVHLNPNVRGPVHERLGEHENIVLIPPIPYQELVLLLERCVLVLTDSGGIQEEAPGLGKPVLVMRDKTERPEGVAAGTVRLVGTDADRIVDGVAALLTDADTYQAMSRATNPYGDGKAAGRIVTRIARFLHT